MRKDAVKGAPKLVAGLGRKHDPIYLLARHRSASKRTLREYTRMAPSCVPTRPVS